MPAGGVRQSLTNALKYNRSPRKEIHVSYGPFSDADAPPAAARGKSGFTVRDNGIGIAAESFGALFEVFRRLHSRDFEGIGVGLTIVKKLVERHEGTLWLQSVVGSGTSFHFTVSDVRNSDDRP